jgi:hypothetical protein
MQCMTTRTSPNRRPRQNPMWAVDSSQRHLGGGGNDRFTNWNRVRIRRCHRMSHFRRKFRRSSRSLGPEDRTEIFRFSRSRRFSGPSRLALMADEGMAQDRVAVSVSEGWGQLPVPSRRLPGLSGSYYLGNQETHQF